MRLSDMRVRQANGLPAACTTAGSNYDPNSPGVRAEEEYIVRLRMRRPEVVWMKEDVVGWAEDLDARAGDFGEPRIRVASLREIWDHPNRFRTVDSKFSPDPGYPSSYAAWLSDWKSWADWGKHLVFTSPRHPEGRLYPPDYCLKHLVMTRTGHWSFDFVYHTRDALAVHAGEVADWLVG